MEQPKTHIGTKLAEEIGATNAHTLESISIAYQAALALIAQGCQISGIITGQRNPIIQLAAAPAIPLPGGIRTSRITRAGVITIYATNYKGAQIQWREETCH